MGPVLLTIPGGWFQGTTPAPLQNPGIFFCLRVPTAHCPVCVRACVCVQVKVFGLGRCHELPEGPSTHRAQIHHSTQQQQKSFGAGLQELMRDLKGGCVGSLALPIPKPTGTVPCKANATHANTKRNTQKWAGNFACVLLVAQPAAGASPR